VIESTTGSECTLLFSTNKRTQPETGQQTLSLIFADVIEKSIRVSDLNQLQSVLATNS
jgi:hypothetical protein